MIFLVQPTSPRSSETRRKHLYRTLFTSSVFFLLTQEFFDVFEGKKFCRLFAYLKGKVVFLTACLLVGFRESCELLHLRGVLNFFLCFRSESATEVVLHGTIHLDSKIRSQNVNFHDSL